MSGANSTAALLAGIQAYSLQQSVLANDIANANTPGFKAETVTFARTLQGQLAPQVTVAPGLMTVNGNGVDLQSVLVQLEQAAGRLNGVDSLLASQDSTLSSVVTDLEGA